MLVGGIKPHYYCLPVAKREKHRVALLKAAVSGDSSFFLGTDSAPHFDSQKESSCGCAGCFTAPNTLPILAQLFEQESLLKQLEKFVSINGAKHYNLGLNKETLTFHKKESPISFKKKSPSPFCLRLVFLKYFLYRCQINFYKAIYSAQAILQKDRFGFGSLLLQDFS